MAEHISELANENERVERAFRAPDWPTQGKTVRVRTRFSTGHPKQYVPEVKSIGHPITQGKLVQAGFRILRMGPFLQAGSD